MFIYSADYSGQKPPVNVCVEDVYFTMRDGVKLYGMYLHPEGVEKTPIIFIRSPYVSNDVQYHVMLKYHYHVLARGYSVFLQHCRGCGRSEGQCLPYVQEHDDGLDSLVQLRQLSTYNGEIYLQGGSYLSAVHFSYMGEIPDDVKGAYLTVMDINRYNILYRNGFFKMGLHGQWFFGVYKDNESKMSNYTEDAFRTLPLIDMSSIVFGRKTPVFDEPLLHPDPRDPYWSETEGIASYLKALTDSKIPVLLIASMQDLFTGGMIDMWNSLSDERKKNCAMIVTPFEHSFVDYPGFPVHFPGANTDELMPDSDLAWFEHIRHHTPMPFAEKGKLKYYTAYDYSWKSADKFEDATGELKFYLTGDRLLSNEAPAGDHKKAITYTYNPFAPAVFKGGCSGKFGGVAVQDPPDSRYDIITFQSEPIRKTCVVRGKGRVKLRVKTDVEDTCFYVRFSLVKEGKAYGLRDDILSISFQHKDYIPNTEVDLNFEFDPHAFRLLPGDRIRLDVSSSAWPHYVPHTNNKGLYSLQTTAQTSRNTIIPEQSILIFPVCEE